MLFFCNQCRVNLEAYITVDHNMTLNVFPCANYDLIKPNLYKMAVTPEYTGSWRTNRGLPRSALTPNSSHYVMISCLLDGKLLFRGTFSPRKAHNLLDVFGKARSVSAFSTLPSLQCCRYRLTQNSRPAALPSTCPGTKVCGTLSPVWLDQHTLDHSNGVEEVKRKRRAMNCI